jgi:hypothetical protein
MNKFSSDEEIPAYLLDRDFFIDCLQDRRMTKTTVKTEVSKVPISNEKQVKATDNKAVKELKPVKEEKKKIDEKQAVAETKVTKTEPVIVKEKAKEPVETKQATNTNAIKITYRVQILALNREKPLIDPEFEDLLEVRMYTENGMYKYTTGLFDTHAEALQYRSEMVRQGFSDAFVVTFANGKRIYVSPSY